MMRSAIPALLAVALLGSACAYKPGSFNGGFTGPRFDGQRYTVGCLDVSVKPHHDAAAEGPAVTIAVGNRCDAAVRVDLGAIRAEGTTLAGHREPMRAYDPNREIRPVTLEARRVGSETIEYHPLRATGPITQLCLDLSRLDTGARAQTPVVACLSQGAPVAAGGVAP